MHHRTFLVASRLAVAIAVLGPASASAEPGPAAEARLADVADRDALVALAALRHPLVRESRHRERALKEGALAEGRLPPPTAGVDLWQVPLTRPARLDEAGMLMVSLRQDIPAPGSLSALSRAGDAEARVAELGRDAAVRGLILDVDRAFVDYEEATLRGQVLRIYADLAADAAASARRRVASGGALADVAAAELDQARTEAERSRADGEARGAAARLSALAGRASQAPLGPPRIPPAETVHGALDELVDRASGTHPDVLVADALRRSASERQHAEEVRSTTPSFSIGVNYFHPVSGMPAGYGASASMSLPWLWGDAAGRARSEHERALAETEAADSARVRIRREVTEAYYAAKTAEARLVALRSRATPMAARAVSASRASYASPSGTGVLSVLSAERAALDVELDAVVARADLDRALAELDFAVGGPVQREAVAFPAPAAEGGAP